MIYFIALIASAFSGFGQFEHLKLGLIIEQMIRDSLKWSQNFSYEHDKFRTDFISTLSSISNAHIMNAQVFPILWLCQTGVSWSLDTAGLRGQIIRSSVLGSVETCYAMNIKYDQKEGDKKIWHIF